MKLDRLRFLAGQRLRKDFRLLFTFRGGELKFTLVFFGWIAMRACIGNFSTIQAVASRTPMTVKVAVYIALLYVLWETTRRFFRGVLLYEKFIFPRVWLVVLFLVSIVESVVWADRRSPYILLDVLMVISWIAWGEAVFRKRSNNEK